MRFVFIWKCHQSVRIYSGVDVCLSVHCCVNWFLTWISGFAISGQLDSNWMEHVVKLKMWSLKEAQINSLTSIHIDTRFLSEAKGGLICGRCWKGLFACMCHEEVFAQCLPACLPVSLSVCLSFSLVSWLSAHDRVHIYSLAEGKTIVPGGFPYLYLSSTKLLLTVTPHTQRAAGFPGKGLGEEGENQGWPSGSESSSCVCSHQQWLHPLLAGSSSSRSSANLPVTPAVGSKPLPFHFHWNRVSSYKLWRGKASSREGTGRTSGTSGSGRRKGSARKENTPSFCACWWKTSHTNGKREDVEGFFRWTKWFWFYKSKSFWCKMCKLLNT